MYIYIYIYTYIHQAYNANDRIYILDVTNIPLSIIIVKSLKLKQTNVNLILIGKTSFSN